MKANEFRLGNYTYIEVGSDYLDRIPVEIKIQHLMLMLLNEAAGDKSEKYRPITLDDEWIEKLGFQCVSNRSWQLGDIVIELSNDGIPMIDKVFLLYVHQLQNLYFLKTGNELKTTLSYEQSR